MLCPVQHDGRVWQDQRFLQLHIIQQRDRIGFRGTLCDLHVDRIDGVFQRRKAFRLIDTAVDLCDRIADGLLAHDIVPVAAADELHALNACQHEGIPTAFRCLYEHIADLRHLIAADAHDGLAADGTVHLQAAKAVAEFLHCQHGIGLFADRIIRKRRILHAAGDGQSAVAFQLYIAPVKGGIRDNVGIPQDELLRLGSVRAGADDRIRIFLRCRIRTAVALQDDLRILVLSVAVDAGEHIFVDRRVHDDLVERLTARFALICQLFQLTADIAHDLDRHAGAIVMQVGLLHVERNVLQRQIRRYPDVIAGRDAGTELMAGPVDEHLLLRKGQGVLIDRQDDVILQRDRIDGICLCIRRDGRKGFFHIDEGSGCEIAAADEDRRHRIGDRFSILIGDGDGGVFRQGDRCALSAHLRHAVSSLCLPGDVQAGVFRQAKLSVAAQLLDASISAQPQSGLIHRDRLQILHLFCAHLQIRIRQLQIRKALDGRQIVIVGRGTDVRKMDGGIRPDSFDDDALSRRRAARQLADKGQVAASDLRETKAAAVLQHEGMCAGIDRAERLPVKVGDIADGQRCVQRQRIRQGDTVALKVDHRFLRQDGRRVFDIRIGRAESAFHRQGERSLCTARIDGRKRLRKRCIASDAAAAIFKEGHCLLQRLYADITVKVISQLVHVGRRHMEGHLCCLAERVLIQTGHVHAVQAGQRKSIRQTVERILPQ